MDAFVEDVAAICKMFPHMMERKTDGQTTVFASLAYATTPNQLGYLMNFAKFVARHTDMEVMYGTTRNEAFHSQLKSYFRNIMIQSRRNAKVVCQIATMGKLIGGTLSSVPTIFPREEHELIRAASRFFIENPLCFRPRLNLRTKLNEAIDEDELPASAKRLRKPKSLFQ